MKKLLIYRELHCRASGIEIGEKEMDENVKCKA